jgi:hypothetical protein
VGGEQKLCRVFLKQGKQTEVAFKIN